jgi:hypothetical protein
LEKSTVFNEEILILNEKASLIPLGYHILVRKNILLKIMEISGGCEM